MLTLALFFSILVGQFFRLQVLQVDKWRGAASKQHTLTVLEPAPRGCFYSNTEIKRDHPPSDKALVADIPKFHLHVDPLSLPRKSYNLIADQLLTSLPRHRAARGDLRHFILLQMHKRARDRILAEWIEPSERSEIESWWLSFHLIERIPRNALFFTPDFQRTYPQGPMLGQILQTVRRQRSKDQSAIPIGGLELTCDRALAGVRGKRRLLRSLKNPMETGITISPSRAGSDVYLTVNHILQAIAEEELEKGVERFGAKGGWALFMDCQTGEILALAHAPTYNPEKYWDYFNQNSELLTRPRALCEAHELGSVFKPLHIAIALTANEELRKRGFSPLFDPEEKIDTRPCRFPGRKEMRDVTVRRYCNLDLAVQKSSNVYMARLVHRIGERLGFAWYRDQLLRLGLTGVTGIEVLGEASASLPQFGGKTAGRWSASTPSSLCLGHSLQLNALHLARAYSALANGGFMVDPHLIKCIGPKALSDKSPSTSHVKKRIFSKEVCERVLKSMAFVAQVGGTGHRAAVPGYGICGKTGTAEKVIGGTYSKQRMISTFVGIAPQISPRYLLLVSVDEPLWGYRENVGLNHRAGVCAAPIFGGILKRSLQYLCVPKEDAALDMTHIRRGWGSTLPVGEKRRKEELKKLHELDQCWNKN